MVTRFISTLMFMSSVIAAPAIAETVEEWGERVLSIQNTLDNDAPLYQSTWPGTHNSNSNNDDDDIHSSESKPWPERTVR